MNRTHFEHIAYALIFQIAIVFITGNWWVGAAFGAAFFLGREHAQAERRSGDEFHALLPKYWNLDSVLDFVAPAVAVVGVAMFAKIH